MSKITKEATKQIMCWEIPCNNILKNQIALIKRGWIAVEVLSEEN